MSWCDTCCMCAERNMPNKLKVLFTVDQLTVGDLVNWLKRANMSIFLLGLYFLAFCLSTVLTKNFTRNESKTERLSQLTISSLFSFFYLSAFAVTLWFARKPRAERVVYCLVTTTALSLFNLGAAILIIIEAPVSGASSYAFFLLGFMSGCVSVYITTKLKQKMLDDAMVAAGGYGSYNVEHGDGIRDVQTHTNSIIALSSTIGKNNNSTTVHVPFGITDAQNDETAKMAGTDIVYSSDTTMKNIEKQ